jgi:peroxiredoxin
MPAMENVYQEYKNDGFVVLAVNSTIQDDPDDARDFYNQLGLNFGIYFDFYGNATNAYQVRSLPTSYFISADGIIREIVIGGPMAEALLITRVENLLIGEY